MLKEYPDHHDADLVLRAYELRRDSVLREARKAIVLDWWPKSLEDVKALVEDGIDVFPIPILPDDQN